MDDMGDTRNGGIWKYGVESLLFPMCYVGRRERRAIYARSMGRIDRRFDTWGALYSNTYYAKWQRASVEPSNENSMTRAIWTLSLSLSLFLTLKGRVYEAGVRSESINSSCFNLLLPSLFLPRPFAGARRTASTPFRARPPFSLWRATSRRAHAPHSRWLPRAP